MDKLFEKDKVYLTKGGEKAKIYSTEGGKDKKSIHGEIGGVIFSWYSDGTCSSFKTDRYDLVSVKEEKDRRITFTQEEVNFMRFMLGFIGGDYNMSPRGIAEGLTNKLSDYISSDAACDLYEDLIDETNSQPNTIYFKPY